MTAPRNAFAKSAEKRCKGGYEMARLKEYYKNNVAPELMKKFSYKNVMQIPKLDKIVINVGAGEARDNSKVFPCFRVHAKMQSLL